ncbi:hypothetical protein E6C27_scaffold2741G00090 [Cucumis melo var. makuwa]|uniref:DNA-directed RNA polymerase I subunit RPA1-like n=1 Tax=Cucumis melo var. makuwa TaxID=1194695 RepID=A0A5A7TLP3_CUCMM|nr:hypothetical protein E6C27_scaffold2741G00090 [Cucumis melo var. makuwa]
MMHIRSKGSHVEKDCMVGEAGQCLHRSFAAATIRALHRLPSICSRCPLSLRLCHRRRLLPSLLVFSTQTEHRGERRRCRKEEGVDSLSVDSIEGHNRESGKGFPTTGPRIEAGNVVTRPLVVACVPSGVRNSVQIGTDAGCLKCASFGSTRLICASFGSTRLICVSFGSTRLICASFESTRLICASLGITRLIGVRVQRGADRRDAGRMREGHMDVSGFLIASADVFC